MIITVENLDEVFSSIEKLNDSAALKTALGRACAVVERAAKEKAPKGTGELRRSITSEIEMTNDGPVGIVFTPLEYAPYVEYGTGLFAESGGRKDVPWHYQDDKGEWHTTSGQHPQPFMRPAYEENKDEIVRILKESIKRNV